jgi:hypothetical protein
MGVHSVIIKIGLLFLLSTSVFAEDISVSCTSNCISPSPFVEINNKSNGVNLTIREDSFFDVLVNNEGDSTDILNIFAYGDSKRNVSVDLSAKDSADASADLFIVGSYIDNLSVKLNGYSGKGGESALQQCANLFKENFFGAEALDVFNALRDSTNTPTDRCVESDLLFLRSTKFICEEGFEELVNDVVTFDRFKEKTSCLGNANSVDICVEKSYEVTCTHSIRFTRVNRPDLDLGLLNQLSQDIRDQVVKKIIVRENDIIKGQSHISNLCKSLSKSEANLSRDEENLTDNGKFTFDNRGYIAPNYKRYKGLLYTNPQINNSGDIDSVTNGATCGIESNCVPYSAIPTDKVATTSLPTIFGKKYRVTFDIVEMAQELDIYASSMKFKLISGNVIQEEKYFKNLNVFKDISGNQRDFLQSPYNLDFSNGETIVEFKNVGGRPLRNCQLQVPTGITVFSTGACSNRDFEIGESCNATINAVGSFNGYFSFSCDDELIDENNKITTSVGGGINSPALDGQVALYKLPKRGNAQSIKKFSFEYSAQGVTQLSFEPLSIHHSLAIDNLEIIELKDDMGDPIIPPQIDCLVVGNEEAPGAAQVILPSGKSAGQLGISPSGIGCGYYDILEAKISDVPTSPGINATRKVLEDGSSWDLNFVTKGSLCPANFTKLFDNVNVTSVSGASDDTACNGSVVTQEDPRGELINWSPSALTRKREYGIEKVDCSLQGCTSNGIALTVRRNQKQNLVSFNTGSGEDGTAKGGGAILVYDIKNSTIESLDGIGGQVGINDLPSNTGETRICYKVKDAEFSDETGADPIVNFREIEWVPLTVDSSGNFGSNPLENFKQVKVLKKTDSSVRHLIQEELKK